MYFREKVRDLYNMYPESVIEDAYQKFLSTEPFRDLPYVSDFTHTVVSMTLVWSASDWALFSPYLASLECINMSEVYKRALRYLFTTERFDPGHVLSEQMEMLRAWAWSPSPVPTESVPLNSDDAHFLVNVLTKEPPDIDQCVYCYFQRPCFLEDMGMGKCSKGMVCYNRFGYHFCTKHATAVQTKKAGMDTRYLLRDGRFMLNMTTLRALPEQTTIRIPTVRTYPYPYPLQTPLTVNGCTPGEVASVMEQNAKIGVHSFILGAASVLPPPP
jgi:hypothetical protein